MEGLFLASMYHVSETSLVGIRPPPSLPLAYAAELQACTAAASEKISHLEETAEATQTTHEGELAALQLLLEGAQVGWWWRGGGWAHVRRGRHTVWAAA